MTQAIRWTQAELNAYLARRGCSPSPAAVTCPATMASLPKAQSTTPPAKRSVIAARDAAIATIENSEITGAYASGCRLILHFRGAKALPVNTLNMLTHFQRVRYRRAWKARVEQAVAAVVGVHTDHGLPFDRFLIHAHRTSHHPSDTDARASYFKAPIDGLTHAGVIVDDAERHFVDFLCSHSRGAPSLTMVVQQVDAQYVPHTQRAATWQLLQDFGAT